MIVYIHGLHRAFKETTNTRRYMNIIRGNLNASSDMKMHNTCGNDDQIIKTCSMKFIAYRERFSTFLVEAWLFMMVTYIDMYRHAPHIINTVLQIIYSRFNQGTIGGASPACGCINMQEGAVI